MNAEHQHLQDMRPIPGLGVDGYFADSTGRIFSTRRGRLREMSQYPVKAYLAVKINCSSHYVGALVCAAFHGPRPHGHETCHNNGQHHDNRATNLRWDTHAANIADAVRHGTQHRFAADQCLGSRKLTEDQVLEIKVKLAAGDRSQRSIAHEYGIDPATITYLKQGKTWSSVEPPGKEAA